MEGSLFGLPSDCFAKLQGCITEHLAAESTEVTHGGEEVLVRYFLERQGRIRQVRVDMLGSLFVHPFEWRTSELLIEVALKRTERKVHLGCKFFYRSALQMVTEYEGAKSLVLAVEGREEVVQDRSFVT